MAETFRMIPATSGAFWIVIGVIEVFLLGMTLLFTSFIYTARNTNFSVSAEGLRITRTLYGRFIPRDQIRIDEVRSVDLEREPGLSPSMRTNGTGLPGYGAGWFKLSNGERALLFLTDRHNVVYIPTNSGYSVLLSVSDTDRFIASLRNE